MSETKAPYRVGVPPAASHPACPTTAGTKLTASDGAAFDLFGHSVATDGDTVVGAVWDDIGTNTDQGSAYVFEPGVRAVPVAAPAAGPAVTGLLPAVLAVVGILGLLRRRARPGSGLEN